MTVEIRDGTVDDYDFLVEMMIEASHWQPGRVKPTAEQALATPDLARYVEGWGRQGDAMVIASEDGEPLGCAWYRHFTAAVHGYGFISEHIPELGIACREAARGRGVGRLLIDALCDRGRDSGVDSICLSASTENYAVRLYRATGFEIYHQNGERLTMLKRLL